MVPPSSFRPWLSLSLSSTHPLLSKISVWISLGLLIIECQPASQPQIRPLQRGSLIKLLLLSLLYFPTHGPSRRLDRGPHTHKKKCRIRTGTRDVLWLIREEVHLWSSWLSFCTTSNIPAKKCIPLLRMCLKNKHKIEGPGWFLWSFTEWKRRVILFIFMCEKGRCWNENLGENLWGFKKGNI